MVLSGKEGIPNIGIFFVFFDQMCTTLRGGGQSC
jgi:hypothetical protein